MAATEPSVILHYTRLVTGFQRRKGNGSEPSVILTAPGPSEIPREGVTDIALT
jgi:hypothetical protein